MWIQAADVWDSAATMPPNVANSAAAKKAAAKKAKRKASQQASNGKFPDNIFARKQSLIDYFVTKEAEVASSQIDEDVPFIRFSYGVVEDKGSLL